MTDLLCECLDRLSRCSLVLDNWQGFPSGISTPRNGILLQSAWQLCRRSGCRLCRRHASVGHSIACAQTRNRLVAGRTQTWAQTSPAAKPTTAVALCVASGEVASA